MMNIDRLMNKFEDAAFEHGEANDVVANKSTRRTLNATRKKLRKAILPLVLFAARTAALTKDRECSHCRKCGDDPNPKCKRHNALDLENDDAVDNLHDLINDAREMAQLKAAKK